MEFTHSNGLGVLQLNHAPEEKKQAWLEPGCGERQEWVRYFAALGAFQLGRFEQQELEKTVAERGAGVIALQKEGIVLQKEMMEIENLNQKRIAQHDAQILRYHNMVLEKEEQIAQIRNSSSWKATRLLRQIGLLKAVITERVDRKSVV